MDINKICTHCMTEVNQEKGMPCPICGHVLGQTMEITHQLKPLTILQGKYLVGDVLGEGGFGITYIGFDLNLEMKVAIKEFYPNGYATREAVSTNALTVYSGQNAETIYKWRDNFLKEARSLGKCSHLPGVVGVRDFFQENNTAYIVLEYLEGTTLKNYAKSMGGKIPASMLLPALEPIFIALEEVHRQGLIHRDISPDNIMLLPGGQMKLLDFGAARDYTEGGEKSLSVMLKPGYAPEEQYRSKGKQGPWSDIYALAGTIYKCLTGVTPPEAMERMREDGLRRPNELGAGLSLAQEEALLKAMAVFAEGRYQTVAQFHDALYVKEGVQPAVRPVITDSVQTAPEATVEPKDIFVPKPEAAGKQPKGKAMWIAVGAAAFVTLCIIILATKAFGSDKKEEPTQTSSSEIQDGQTELDAQTDTDIQTEAPENEILRIKPEIYDCFGMTYEQVVEVYGEPDFDSGEDGFWTRQLRYGDCTFEVSTENNALWFISGSIREILDFNPEKKYQIEDVLEELGIADNANYLVGEGVGDFGFDEGVHFVSTEKNPYVIEISYDGNTGALTEDSRINLYRGDLLESTEEDTPEEPAERLPADRIEDEVLRIRDIYNETVAAVNEESYWAVALDEWTTAYYDDAGYIREIFSKDKEQKWYTRYFYFENGDLIFAYYEGDDSHRLYFWQEKLFRWLYVPDINDPSVSEIHDNEESESFYFWEECVLQESKEIYQWAEQLQ